MTPRTQVVAHLGDAQPGTAWADADGAIWVVWSDGWGWRTMHYTARRGRLGAFAGPFHLVGEGLTDDECNAIVQTNARGLHKIAAVMARGGVVHDTRLDTELPVEHVDEPGRGLRWAVRQ